MRYANWIPISSFRFLYIDNYKLTLPKGYGKRDKEVGPQIKVPPVEYIVRRKEEHEELLDNHIKRHDTLI